MSVAGLRPGFGLGGTTHSLLVMLSVLGCDAAAGDATAAVAMWFIAAEAMIGSGLFAALGRMAIGGAVEHEDVGVETLVGEAAEVGVDTELGESLVIVVVMDKVLAGAAPGIPELKPPLGAARTTAAMPVAVL